MCEFNSNFYYIKNYISSTDTFTGPPNSIKVYTHVHTQGVNIWGKKQTPTGKQNTSSSVDLLFLIVDICMPWETWRKAETRGEEKMLKFKDRVLKSWSEPKQQVEKQERAAEVPQHRPHRKVVSPSPAPALLTAFRTIAALCGVCYVLLANAVLVRLAVSARTGADPGFKAPTA